MLSIQGTEIRRIVITFFIATALLISLPTASAQPDPGQQAAAQAQQDAITALQAVQQANDQMMKDAQQANQQAMQQAGMNAPPAGPPHSGYGRADKPTFSPRPGTFSGPVRVNISDPTTPKLEIFYTLDGSEPTIASTRYTGPVLVSSTTKLRAIARSPIYSPSRIAKGKYVIR